jgi:hypothetical protein
VGTVAVTSYGGAEGEPFSATDVGLSTIDAISLRHGDEVGGALSGAAGGGVSPIRSVVYAKTTGHFYLYTVDSDGQTLGTAEGNSVQVLEFVAEGDSANDVELT